MPRLVIAAAGFCRSARLLLRHNIFATATLSCAGVNGAPVSELGKSCAQATETARNIMLSADGNRLIRHVDIEHPLFPRHSPDGPPIDEHTGSAQNSGLGFCRRSRGRQATCRNSRSRTGMCGEACNSWQLASQRRRKSAIGTPLRPASDSRCRALQAIGTVSDAAPRRG